VFVNPFLLQNNNFVQPAQKVKRQFVQGDKSPRVLKRGGFFIQFL
jgi:hypothetical protein